MKSTYKKILLSPSVIDDAINFCHFSHIEQFAFDPFSITLFLYTMSIIEGKTSEEAKKEVRNLMGKSVNQSILTILFCFLFLSFTIKKVTNKFLSIYAIGFVYWPIAQTINFAWVKPRNQVIYVSFASLIWTTFLAIMKVCDQLNGKYVSIILSSSIVIYFLVFQGHSLDESELPILSKLRMNSDNNRQLQQSESSEK